MVFSWMLPGDFCYTQHGVDIRDGVLVEGTISKVHLSGGQGSILFLLYKCYDVQRAIDFLDQIQSISNEYFKWHGFTAGIEDCIEYNRDEIQTVIQKGFIESEELERTIQNPYIREARINAVLSNTTNIGMKIANIVSNNFVDTIKAGSKGSLFNIAQITSLLGQQCIENHRFTRTMYGKRVLPYYPFEGDLSETMTEKYESQGFISNSFIKSLNPCEFFLHACTGREGVISTSMRTASSGYSARRLIKIAEDAVVQHDCTVRTQRGLIVQWIYGYDGLDPKHTIMVNGSMQFCNVQHLVSQCLSQFRNLDSINIKN
jgi:DNA-directed RNA polymerase subunit A'